MLRLRKLCLFDTKMSREDYQTYLNKSIQSMKKNSVSPSFTFGLHRELVSGTQTLLGMEVTTMDGFLLPISTLNITITTRSSTTNFSSLIIEYEFDTSTINSLTDNRVKLFE